MLGYVLIHPTQSSKQIRYVADGNRMLLKCRNISSGLGASYDDPCQGRPDFVEPSYLPSDRLFQLAHELSLDL